ncbi:MAG: hypothetical protein HQ582_32690, partial [Planctomycetes bacterium]|nr:hypothetical protein [Planctomycetota bacterium]
EVQLAETEYREKIEAAGCEFVPVDREAFRELAKEKIPGLFEASWMPGLYRRVSEAR